MAIEFMRELFMLVFVELEGDCSSRRRDVIGGKRGWRRCRGWISGAGWGEGRESAERRRRGGGVRVAREEELGRHESRGRARRFSRCGSVGRAFD